MIDFDFDKLGILLLHYMFLVVRKCMLCQITVIFFFNLKKTAALEHLSETTCRDWFRRFKDGDFNVDDA